MNDRFQVDLLGRDQWKSILKIKSDLPAEDTQRACAGAISLAGSVVPDIPEQVEVGLHAQEGTGSVDTRTGIGEGRTLVADHVTLACR